MDIGVKQWLRSWMLKTATVGLLSPGILTAQTAQPAAKPADRGAASQPAPAQSASAAIQLAAVELNEHDPQLAESEVEARLRELYERDGREMPNLALTPSSTAAQQPMAAPQAAPANQPRYSAAPSIAPAPKPQNKVTGFFKRLVPGGSKKSPTQTATQPPRQLQQAYPSPPVAASLPPVAQPRNVTQPRTVAQPQGVTASQPTVQYQQPAANFGQTTSNATAAPPPAAQPVRNQAPSAQAARAATAVRPAAVTPTRPNAGLVQQAPVPRIVPRSNGVELPVAEEDQVAAPRIGTLDISSADEELDADSMELDDLELDQTPQATTPSIASPAPGFDEEFPDPFAGAAEGETASEPIENPYTGRTLEPLDAPPAPLAPVIAPQARVDRTATDETTAAKMRRIIQRTDMKGLKGFCPVTLRDQRELADSRPEHVATYRGQKFYCASKVAQAKFEADPARYAPAAYGADVVVLTDDQDVAEGTLDYAAWYKGRLYLFSSQETHDTFVANPERYASPAGIE